MMQPDIGELFQQINYLRNELNLASQDNAKQLEEIEKEKEEVKSSINKHQTLIIKTEAKANKLIALEDTLRCLRIKVELIRQVRKLLPAYLF